MGGRKGHWAFARCQAQRDGAIHWDTQDRFSRIPKHSLAFRHRVEVKGLVTLGNVRTEIRTCARQGSTRGVLASSDRLC